MKSRVWLVPSKSSQKAWSPSQVREAIKTHCPLLVPTVESLCWFLGDSNWGKCDLWNNEARSSTDRVCRCLSPTLPFPMAELALYNSSFFGPDARSSTFHRRLVEFYLIVPSRDWQWNSLLMERKGNIIPILCYFSKEAHKEESGLLSIHLFPFLKFSKFNQPEQICVFIFKLMVPEFS